MDTLQIDLSLARRTVRVELSLTAGRETFAVVGPSGAGKTSVLRAVAGLVRPERGRIVLGGDVLLDTAAGIDRPAEERGVGFVFQEYALFPHLTVRQNVAYGGRARADELLERFRIGHLAKARPGELSGGERQRVGLARALARDPGVLLLDEPLAALDAHTRTRVRGELRQILDDLGIPVLLVTHDFQDAAALAARVAVMVDGRLTQTGTPSQLLSAPADAFVASFTGANVLPGHASPGPDGLTAVALDGGLVVYSTDDLAGPVDVAVYPWEVAIGRGRSADSALNHVSGPVTSLVRVGNRARVQVGGLVGEITAASAAQLDLAEGTVVVASFKAAATRLVPRAGAEPRA